MKYLPDTSALIDEAVSKLIKEGKIKGKILIHRAVISELEAQANKGKEIGFIGLNEIKKLKEISDVIFVGERPGEFEIKHAKAGEIDTMLIEEAKNSNSIFITLDKVAAEAAEAYGVKVLYIEKKLPERLTLDKFFDKNTMSVHLKEGVPPIAKKGKPGDWKFKKIREEPIREEELKQIERELIENVRKKNGFIEIERRHSIIIQAGKYRVVIAHPPLSDGIEITAVRPIKQLNLEDYKLSKKIIERLKENAEGIIISGSPGAGKTTFAEALANFYIKNKKIVKTIETPRDMQLPKDITQYSKSFGSHDELRDILLLSRPDYTIFDELRNPSDFDLYSDLRLTGIGMIGVIHASKPIDAIQRFLKRTELGLIPSIIDTVIYIEGGEVKKVYTIRMKVKVPKGMYESDLARPVVEVINEENGMVEYEIYAFGDQVNVVPIKSNLLDLVKKTLRAKEVEIKQNKIYAYVEKKNIKYIGNKLRKLKKSTKYDIEVIKI